MLDAEVVAEIAKVTSTKHPLKGRAVRDAVDTAAASGQLRAVCGSISDVAGLLAERAVAGMGLLDLKAKDALATVRRRTACVVTRGGARRSHAAPRHPTQHLMPWPLTPPPAASPCPAAHPRDLCNYRGCADADLQARAAPAGPCIHGAARVRRRHARFWGENGEVREGIH